MALLGFPTRNSKPSHPPPKAIPSPKAAKRLSNHHCAKYLTYSNNIRNPQIISLQIGFFSSPTRAFATYGQASAAIRITERGKIISEIKADPSREFGVRGRGQNVPAVRMGTPPRVVSRSGAVL
jgi:hypothetical protein